jgi:hypothetical protein
MATKKSTAAKMDPENPVQVLKEGTCPTSSGKSTLSYNRGIDDTGAIHLKVAGNDGGGFFSNEWISYTDIQAAINDWPEDQGITSMMFRKTFRGKSANTQGFLIAVLVAETLLEPMPGKSRVHQACDPSTFLDSAGALQGDATTTGKKRAPTARAKAVPKAKAKAKTPAKRPSTRKKSPARSKNRSTRGRNQNPALHRGMNSGNQFPSLLIAVMNFLPRRDQRDELCRRTSTTLCRSSLSGYTIRRVMRPGRYGQGRWSSGCCLSLHYLLDVFRHFPLPGSHGKSVHRTAITRWV